MKRREMWMVGLMLATVAATWWASTLEGDEQPEVKTTKARSSRKQLVVAAPVASTSTAVQVHRTAFPPMKQDLFAVLDFQPPPPPAPKVVATPAAPRAPALPFKYQGRMEEEGKTVVFLSAGDAPVLAREGETIQGSYRVEKITQDSMTFIYEPLGQRQQLSLR